MIKKEYDFHLSYDPLEDGISRLECLDKMGSDLGIANAARVSYLGESKGEEQDKKLIHYLYKNQHWTPFRQQELKFRVKCPLFVARQWRTHSFSEYLEVQWVFNEQSARYIKMPEEFYYSGRRLQAKKNKQGSVFPESGSKEEAANIEWTGIQNDAFHHAVKARDKALKIRVAKELANRILPQTIYTSFIWTVNLQALINFLILRTSDHAQYEIRQYGLCLESVLEEEFPWTYECYEKHKHQLGTNDLDKNLTYLAGLFDGEGCFTISTDFPRNRLQASAQIQIREQSIVEAFKRTFGGSISKQEPRKKHWAPIWCYHVTGQNLQSMVENLIPHLRIKKEHAKIILRHQELKHSKNKPENVMEIYAKNREELMKLNKKGEDRSEKEMATSKKNTCKCKKEVANAEYYDKTDYVSSD